MLPFGSAFAGASLFDKPISIWLGGGVLSTRIVAPDQFFDIVLIHPLAAAQLTAIAARGAKADAMRIEQHHIHAPFGQM